MTFDDSSNDNLFMFLLFSKGDRSIYLSICDRAYTTVITIVRRASLHWTISSW